MKHPTRRNLLTLCTFSCLFAWLSARLRVALAQDREGEGESRKQMDVISGVLLEQEKGLDEYDVILYAGSKHEITKTKAGGAFEFPAPSTSSFVLVFKEPKGLLTVLVVDALAGKRAQRIAVSLDKAGTFINLYKRTHGLQSLIAVALANPEGLQVFKSLQVDFQQSLRALTTNIDEAELSSNQSSFLQTQLSALESSYKGL